jgi:hypothetical protein
MTPNAQNIAGNEPVLPSRWATEVEPQMAAGEEIQAWLEIDLDSRLQFANGLVIVTDQRLLARARVKRHGMNGGYVPASNSTISTTPVLARWN